MKSIALEEQIRQRDKAVRDYENDMAIMLSQGRKEGRAEGVSIGEIQKAVKMVNKLMTQSHYTLENALEFAEIDRETYEKYST